MAALLRHARCRYVRAVAQYDAGQMNATNQSSTPGRSRSTQTPAGGLSRQTSAMWQRLFRRFEGRSATLQAQIRDMLANAIIDGVIGPERALPSSRALASALGVSRVTVTLALQHLCDAGLLAARARSGYYVNPDRPATSLGPPAPVDGGDAAPPQWDTRLRLTPSAQRNIVKPPNWQSLPYPFIYGQFDATLFPVAAWRECAQESLHVGAIRGWAPDHIDRDHEPLIDQIQQRLLPARGIWAKRDEILVTAGAQQATFMLATLLVDADTTVGIEDPGYPDARNNFALRSRRIVPLPVDADGLVVDVALARCRYVYVTPSHQCPTTVTMPLARRQQLLEAAQTHDVVLIEDDHESELNHAGRPTAALKSLDSAGRVIYLGSLSKTLAHGLRLGYVVAPAALIAELRALRRLIMRHPPTNNEHTAARFIAHGHHESTVRRLNAAYRERARTLRAALQRHAPTLRCTEAHGGSALWVAAGARVDTRVLAERARERGIVIEPGDVFFASEKPPRQFMRLGYSSIPADRIDAGVRELARLL
jgi:GntR family transcriptional regulator / MocR family aminotransferase